MRKLNHIKKHLPKVLSATMSLTIMCSAIGVTAYSAGVENNSGKPAAASAAEKTAPEANDSKKFSKEETVYVIADAEGAPKKVIVSDWIKNPEKADKVTDKSNLSDIETTQGDQEFTINEKKMVEWSADGEDIYYKGTSNEQLPVGVTIKYELDGKACAPDELAGKSGKLKITFSYTNRQFEEVKIGDKKEKIYVPFVMMTGMMLDNEKFKNVSVSNGKVINDGSRTYVAGFALPGFQETLGIKEKDLKLPTTVEVTAEVEDFELATTLTVATNEIFNNIDTSKLDNTVKDLKEKLDKMTDGVKQLADGSSKLYSGLNTLLEKSGELIDGVEKLYGGAEKLKNGTDSLESGAQQLDSGAAQLDEGAASLEYGAESLDSGAGDLENGAYKLDNGVSTLRGHLDELSGGLGKISANSAKLKGGAMQVFNTILSTADAQIAAAGLTAPKLTIDNYNAVLDGLIGQLSDEAVSKLAYDTAYKTVSAAVNSQSEVIRRGVEAEYRRQVTNGVLAAAGLGMDMDSYEAAVAAGSIPQEVQAQISTGVASQMSGMQGAIDSTVESKINELIEQNMQGQEVQDQIAAAVAKAAAGRESLQALKTQLNSYNEFYNGVVDYADGVDKASGGAKQIFDGSAELKSGTGELAYGTSKLKSGTGQLSSGASQLKGGTSDLKNGTSQLSSGASTLSSGASQLFDGIGTLKNGSSSLLDGVKQLKDGAMKLDDGLKKFKKEGVDVIVKAVDGDVKPLSERFKAMVQVSKNYKSFSGTTDEMDGKVNFIFKTDSIKPEDSDE